MNGPFGNGFPYVNFHEMNMDWIIRIAKDFLDQYSHIQETIESGLTDIGEKTDAGLADLQTKYDILEGLLDAWYTEHSQDIADKLADALNDLNAWYIEHEGYLDQYLADSVDTFQSRAETIAEEVIESIPEDYTAMGADVTAVKHVIDGLKTDILNIEWVRGSINNQGADTDSQSRLRTRYMIPTNDFNIVYAQLASDNDYELYLYDANQDLISHSGWVSDSGYLHIDTASYFRMIIRHHDNSTVVASDASSMITLKGIALSTYFKFNGELPDGTDLDDLIESGWYSTISSATYPHAPNTDSGQRIIIVYSTKIPPLNNSFRFMFFYNYTTKHTEVRTYSSGNWNMWKDLQTDTNYDMYFRYQGEVSTGTDLNTLYKDGWYESVGSGVYTNSPESDDTIGQRIIKVYNCNTTPTDETYRIMTYYNRHTQLYGIRFYYSNSWHEWQTISLIKNIEDTLSESFTKNNETSQGNNTGINKRIVSYNVSMYKNGTETFIPTDKILAFRKMIYKTNPDIFIAQEDNQYIDSDSSQEANNYLYYPVLPVNIGASGRTSIRAKTRTGNVQGRVEFTEYTTQAHNITYAMFNEDNKNILVVSCHANWNSAGDGGNSNANIAIREQQFTDLFQWITQEITLKKYGTDEDITCPDHTHVIIGIDANTITSDDKTNLQELANQYDFILGNGGHIGWFKTNMIDDTGLDNIIVSDNIIINNIESLSSIYTDLYSDHVPLVANITLL